MAAQLRMRSTLSTVPEIPRQLLWLSVGFEQANRGTISVSCLETFQDFSTVAALCLTDAGIYS